MFIIVVFLAAISDLLSGHDSYDDNWIYAVILILCDLVTITATIYFWELLK